MCSGEIPQSRRPQEAPAKGARESEAFLLRLVGGRRLFSDLCVGEALAPRIEETGRTVEGASFPRR